MSFQKHRRRSETFLELQVTQSYIAKTIKEISLNLPHIYVFDYHHGYDQSDIMSMVQNKFEANLLDSRKPYRRIKQY